MQQLALDIGLRAGPSLDNFWAGPNSAAREHMALWIGSKQDGRTHRSPVPTYFWGVSGAGKTHLLLAAREALHGQGAQTAWLDATAREAPEYDAGWSAVFLDDVHLYTAQQQHWAFNWFVNAQTHQCPVVAAGEAAPVALKLRDDLRTRLGWGHVFGLQLLTEPERRAVLRQSADDRGLFLRDDVMDFMLTRFSRDLGSLMELLDLMDRYALQTQRAITIPFIKTMLDNQ